MARSRAWTFTINNDSFNDLITMIDSTFSYLCFGFEICPTTDTPHIQGYIYLHDAKTAKQLSKILPRAHTEISKGTIKENQVYTSKLGDDNWYEFGDRPEQGHAKWDQICDVMADPTSNPHLYNQYNKMYRQLTLSKKKDHQRFLKIVHIDSIYVEAKEYDTVCFDFETYDGEEVLFLNLYQSDIFLPWINGFPQKIKRGYELICIDPQVIYLKYDEKEQYNYLFDKYEQYLDF